jgi:hypothetical protein
MHEATGDRAGCSAGTQIDVATRCSYRYRYRYRQRIEELDAVFLRLQPDVWLLGGGGSGYLRSTWHGSGSTWAQA